MNDTLCPHCFADKGRGNPCPHCGYDDSEPRGPLVLPLRATLPGPLVVGRVLGQPGGFGITYLGWDPQLNARVAIKEYLPREWAGRESGGTTVVPHSRTAEEAFRYGLEQFLAEGRILAQLDHPNIVQVRQYFEANGTAYLVMDYYEGCSLEEYLEQQGGRVAEETARRLILPVLDGLRAVHGRGILHRDLKPQNIYLARVAAGGVRPVLLDFGAARQALGERSRSLTVMLTPGYAPYELYHRKGRQGPWTDIYAVGVVLYRMVTGETPPEAPERRELDELRPATAYGVSAELSAVLLAALAVAPEGRPQSVEAFQERLGFRAPPPVVEPPPAPVSVPAVKRGWGWPGLAALMVLVGVLGAGLWWLYQEQVSQRQALETRLADLERQREEAERKAEAVRQAELAAQRAAEEARLAELRRQREAEERKAEVQPEDKLTPIPNSTPISRIDPSKFIVGYYSAYNNKAVSTAWSMISDQAKIKSDPLLTDTERLEKYKARIYTYSSVITQNARTLSQNPPVVEVVLMKSY